MAKNCFVYETLNDVKSMSVKKTSDGLMHLSGVFGVCGVMNNNKRIYVRENYAKMIEDLKSRIVAEGCPGELEHPNSMNITLENVSHKINSIDIDENGVISGEITLLNTPKGKIAQAIVEGGLPLFISSRAQGEVANDGKVTLEFLKTYDLVGSPGFSQARLKLNEGQVAESINESIYYVTENNKNIDENDMTNQELIEKIELLESEVQSLRKELDAKPSIELVAEGVQDWIINEYSPEVEKWIKSECVNENNVDVEALADSIQKWIVEEYSPEIEKWVIEHYTPEIEKWVVEEYSPEIEKWVREEYSDGLQTWLVEEYSPVIEKWVKEEYSKGVQAWIIEHYSPEVDQWVKDTIKESKNDDKTTVLANIDEMLNILDKEPAKAKYSRKQMIAESKQVDENEPLYIRQMPESKRIQWNMATDEVKEGVRRRAKLYNFVNEDAIANFWENIDLKDVKPVKNIYEGLENVQDERERAIRARLRSFSNR